MSDETIAYYARLVADPDIPNVHCTYTDEDGTIIVMVEDDAPELLPPSIADGVRIVKAPRFRAPLPFMPLPEPDENEGPPAAPLYIPTERIRPVPGGVSVGHYKITAGTVGLWVRDKLTGKTGVLSNNHVLAAVDSGKPGDDILQPGQADGGNRPGDTIADLTRFVPMTNGGVKTVDCAIAEAKTAEMVDLRINELGYCYGIGDVYSGQMIWKSGRTTGLSAGKITSTNVTVQVYYTNTEYVTYTDCFTSGIYSGPGDSGSAILDFGGDLLLGLLFAGNGVQTIGCKARNIASQLQIETITPPEIRSSQFVDVSHWQGDIHSLADTVGADKSNIVGLTASTFATMKARGVRGVVMKVSQGASLVDDRFAEYYAGAKNAGLLVGGYIFVDPAEANAQAHFLNFVSALGDRTLDLPPVLDCEKAGASAQAITACIQNLSEMLAEHFGTLPMIYTNASFWNTNVLPWSGWADHPLWVAYWKLPQTLTPLLPNAWKGVANQPHMWQYTVTDAAAFFGVSSTQLDLNKTYPIFETLLDEPPPPPETVRLSVQIVGSGSVLPAAGNYGKGDIISLQATPASGWRFVSWSGDISGGANPYSLVMDTDKSIIATFEQSEGGVAVFEYIKGVTQVENQNIRRVPTTANNTPIGTLPKGTTVNILAIVKDAAGNDWGRIGYDFTRRCDVYAAILHNGTTYIRYIMVDE